MGFTTANDMQYSGDCLASRTATAIHSQMNFVKQGD